MGSNLAQYIKRCFGDRIVLELKKSKYLNTLGNEFLKFEVEWIVIKISRNGKSDNIALLLFTQLLIPIYILVSKLLNLSEVLFREILFYIVR